MNAPEVVRRYAVTLLEAADETGVIEPITRDVEGLVATLDGSEELLDFLANPLISPEIQANALRQLFTDKVGELTLSFLQLMGSRGRAALIAVALQAFLELVAEREGVVGAEVRSAIELSPQQLQNLQERLERYTGRKVRLEAQVDANVRGGVIARVGDTVFDGSINTHLERLRLRLAG
ncbi:MAG: ATP synthase F1 subunit delta [Gemmatimonadetes bacterium]|jgi:F-type H+-transporting ATPase subunit delta|nr:ATP synthase F1 subunit delta [Gemmatimonadota bacterium]MBT5325322.1 ATP synthase F1 subunit delta [Gemmatimonadota bacterium]MBT5447823.1 ATP synthase F1 subunit delta [Gemmatimonadota bacterium]MBT5801606.1 ATP synthase F1 subunit delta [Gemmatimonadota bacterium]MBT6621706.1 ATP synthase F1 subunit delta [Gemmatimonadota bacterium]|tara:strand:+ start:1243 stop:1779 length:537 start_codon:yes stop_codon:yes gene_type:complete